MILCGISDEAGNSLASQIQATRELGWKHLEMRNVVVDGFPKGNFHDIPDTAFDLAVEQLAAAGIGVHCFASTIGNLAKKIEDPFDITVAESNARDLVIDSGPAVSPPDEENTGAWQFYLHPHQEDNLLALHGGRTFYLVNLGWNYPYHIVRLETGGDILRIPPGTFHRSVSDPDGSVVLNQAVREEGASVVREFRVYNSRLIPRLFATTFKTAPLPKLHGVSW